MDADKYNQTLLHVAAVLTTACFGGSGTSSVNVVAIFREVVDELQKQNVFGPRPK